MTALPIFYSFRRCPYAMRARLAIAASGLSVELCEVVLKNASSVKSVGELRLRKLAKHVIQGEFGDSEGAKPVGFSHGYFDLVVQALDNATGELLFCTKVVDS